MVALLLGGAWVLGGEVPDAVRTQTLRLSAGWNAVFLEVSPSNPDPAAVFSGLPIERVAGFLDRTASAQFVSDPSADLFGRAGWGVWYSEDRPDAFLRTLHAIHGGQGYLVECREAFTWSVTGAVVTAGVEWQADAFNLVGFTVADPGAPTFAEFFAGSPAHRHNRIYRLQDGVWRRVTDASGESMKAGEAFWIFCRGASSYQGPLAIRTALGHQVLLGAGSEDVVLRNATGVPVTATVEHVPSAGPPVPLSLLIRAVGGDTPIRDVSVPRPDGAWVQALPPLEAGSSLRVPMEARTEDMTRPRQVSLLKISTDLGTETWLPVVALRQDLEEQ